MWRYTGKPVMLAIFDARACIPLLLAVVWWAWWTLELAGACIVFFTIINWLGLSVPAFIRLLRRMIVGPVRAAVPAWQRRRLA
jgi:intracellular multiplication protein IcmT